MSKEQIEEELKKYLGVQSFIWLPRGLYGTPLATSVTIAIAYFERNNCQSYRNFNGCQGMRTQMVTLITCAASLDRELCYCLGQTMKPILNTKGLWKLFRFCRIRLMLVEGRFKSLNFISRNPFI